MTVSHLLIATMPLGPHDEACGWWEGGLCNCKPAMLASVAVEQHCHECDFVNSYRGDTPCSCQGYCICGRLAEEGCDCVGRVPVRPDP